MDWTFVGALIVLIVAMLGAWGFSKIRFELEELKRFAHLTRQRQLGELKGDLTLEHDTLDKLRASISSATDEVLRLHGAIEKASRAQPEAPISAPKPRKAKGKT